MRLRAVRAARKLSIRQWGRGGGRETVRETVGVCGRAGDCQGDSGSMGAGGRLSGRQWERVGGRETIRETVGACGRAGDCEGDSRGVWAGGIEIV